MILEPKLANEWRLVVDKETVGAIVIDHFRRQRPGLRLPPINFIVEFDASLGLIIRWTE